MKNWIIIVMILLGCQNHQRPSWKQQLTKDLTEVLEHTRLMGMSVVLMKEGEVIYDEGIGLANWQKREQITSETAFRVASISKFVTSIALMQLVEKNLVDLDRDISQYLGWKLNHPLYTEDSITLRQLMSHQSSIRDGTGYGQFLQDMHQEHLGIRDLFEEGGTYYSEDMFADEPPGTAFNYSNAAWGIVASVIEKTTGVTFDTYCNQQIFDPMGLRCSYNVHDIDLNVLSPLYRFQNNHWTAQVDDYSENPRPQLMYPEYYPGKNGVIYAPQEGLRCSARDLAKIALMFMHNGKYQGAEILQPESIRVMSKPQWEFDGANGDTWNGFFQAYGLGVHLLTNKDSAKVEFPSWPMIGHAGIAYGLLSDMYFDMTAKSGIIFIMNGSANPLEEGKESAFF